jgi:alanine racemase
MSNQVLPVSPVPNPPACDEAAAAAAFAAASSAPNAVRSGSPLRPAWVELDLAALRGNFKVINAHKPSSLKILSVVKDNAYGHGAFEVSSAALEAGAAFLALSTVEEAVSLRERGVTAPMLLLGDRQLSELPWCLSYNLTCCLSDPATALALAQAAAAAGKRVPVHLKVNTGMNRYGVRWTEAAALAEVITNQKTLVLEGALTHFAQSDETDKTFANLQFARFQEAMAELERRGMAPKLRHVCNSGGFLDLAHAWQDMVRIGLLQFGVFPSSVCKRLPGITSVMSVKARIASIQRLEAGDTVGYGMRFKAESPRRIAVIPVGYGDGFPRVRNQGFGLVRGRRAPLVGGVAMDALTLDVTDIPEAQTWDEVVLMGRQGTDEITVHELAKLKSSVSYDVLTNWRSRLPRVFVNRTA